MASAGTRSLQRGDSAIEYRPQLDGVRAIAIAIVVLHHFAPGIWKPYVPAGELGVRIFFVLSGFLITQILFVVRGAADGSARSLLHATRQFYIRRTLRIWPIYYLALAVGYAFDCGPLAARP